VHDDVGYLREPFAKGFLQLVADVVRVGERSCASAARACRRNPTHRRLRM
jgi:hypothetical protein